MTQTAQHVAVHAQYVRDFSFENPNAPQIFPELTEAPALTMGINVQTRPLKNDHHEVVLIIKLDAKAGEKTAFIAELAYAGVFGLPPLPEEQVRAFLLIEAPRLLFPFARAILADAIRDGGYPPVLLNPVDFFALYQAQASEKTPVNEA